MKDLILILLENNPDKWYSVVEISNALGLSRTSINRRLDVMKRMGWVLWKKVDKSSENGSWRNTFVYRAK